MLMFNAFAKNILLKSTTYKGGFIPLSYPIVMRSRERSVVSPLSLGKFVTFVDHERVKIWHLRGAGSRVRAGPPDTFAGCST